MWVWYDVAATWKVVGIICHAFSFCFIYYKVVGSLQLEDARQRSNYIHAGCAAAACMRAASLYSGLEKYRVCLIGSTVCPPSHRSSPPASCAKTLM